MFSNFSFGSVALRNFIEMEEYNDYTPERLEMCSYRYLQQISKKMGLPSNVKKVQLVTLIHAKKSRTPDEVENIIHQVKQERQRLSQAKKNRKNRKKIRLQVYDYHDRNLCGTEVSSTSNIQSPPITVTPKSHLSVRYSPEIIQYRPKQTVLNLNKTLIRKSYPSPKKSIESDRVLRSFNVKSNYGLMNSVIGVIKAQNSMANHETRINIFGQDGRTQRLNVTAIVRKRPVMSDAGVQVSRNMTTYNPIKRQRALSGIYPLENIPKPRQYMKSVQNNQISQINTYLQPNYHQRNEEQNTDITVQDIIDSNVSQSLSTEEYHDNRDNDYRDSDNRDNDNRNNDNHYNDNRDNDNHYNDNRDNDKDSERYSVYYHKKIRPEQVKSVEKDWALPKINDVFSQFSDVHRRDLCQPIYVQVSEESERIYNYPHYTVHPNVNNTTMLESLYNFKNQFVLNYPLLQVTTTSNTRCVYSTPTIATPMAQPSHTVVSNEYYNSCERDRQRQNSTHIETLPRMYDYFRLSEQEVLQRDFRCNEVMSTSGSSLETGLDSSQELGANVTIPEMVEDAMELISQDGDYMERIGMALEMQFLGRTHDHTRAPP